MKSELCRAVAKFRKPFTFHLQFHDASASFLVVLATVCTSITRRCSQGCDDLETLARVRSRLLGKRPVVGFQEESESAVDVCGPPESSSGRSAVCGTVGKPRDSPMPPCRRPALSISAALRRNAFALIALRVALRSACGSAEGILQDHPSLRLRVLTSTPGFQTTSTGVFSVGPQQARPSV